MAEEEGKRVRFRTGAGIPNPIVRIRIANGRFGNCSLFLLPPGSQDWNAHRVFHTPNNVSLRDFEFTITPQVAGLDSLSEMNGYTFGLVVLVVGLPGGEEPAARASFTQGGQEVDQTPRAPWDVTGIRVGIVGAVQATAAVEVV